MDPEKLRALTGEKAADAGVGFNISMRPKEIAGFIGVSQKQWCWAKTVLLSPAPAPGKRQLKRQRRQAQAELITSAGALHQQATLNIRERAELANARLGEQLFTASAVRAMFHAAGVKRKKIRLRPRGLISDKLLAKHAVAKALMHEQVRDYLARGFVDVFADESCFTSKNGYADTAFARKGQNITGWALPAERKENCVSVAGAISSHRGHVHYAFRVGAFDGPAFADFLEGLHKQMLGLDYFVLLDNATIHISDPVKEVVAKHGIHLVHSPAYQPWYNSIEMAWQLAK